MANVKLKVNKKTTIILLVVLFLVIGGTGGYLLWRVNQQDTVAPTDSSAGPVTCEKGADCPACIWPKVGWCRKGADGKWTCGCEYCNNRTPGEGPYCLDTEPKCHPTENCPSGYNEFVVNPNCENMVSNGEAEIQRMLESHNVPNPKECTEGGQVCYRECSTACDGCNNKYIYRIYCVKEDSPPDEPPVEEPEPFCGDGNLDPGEECDPKNNTVKCPLGECTSKCLCPCDGVGKWENIVFTPSKPKDGETVTYKYRMGASKGIDLRTIKIFLNHAPADMGRHLTLLERNQEGKYTLVEVEGKFDSDTYKSGNNHMLISWNLLSTSNCNS